MEGASTTSSTASSVDGRSAGVVGGGASDFLNRGMFSSNASSSSNNPQQQQESLLVGGAGGFSLGNGFGNNESTGLGAVASASSSGTSFDLSDFPSLGGGAGISSGTAGSGNGLAAALREQQQMLAHQQQQQQQQMQLQLQGGTIGAGVLGGSAVSKQQKGSNLYMLAMTGNNGNFNMATEDFPALGGGAPSQSVGGVTNGSLLNVSSLLGGSGLSQQQQQQQQQQGSTTENAFYGGSGLSSGGLDGGAGLLGSAGLGGLGGLRNTGTALPSSALATNPGAGAIGTTSTLNSGNAPGSTAGNALGGDYGLLGLLGVIRMTDADRNALALGSDLQLLGLNLGSTEQIYSAFASPWTDSGATKEPHYQVRPS
jgi:CCR4-NOT transcription complex subunit 2